MELNFDSRGYLWPYDRIRITLEVFKETFVQAFEDESPRHKLYANYTRFVEDFTQLVTPSFAQWIGGSFVTTSKNPRDIDLVTILDGPVFLHHERLINQKFRMRAAKLEYGLDSYMLPRYNEGEDKYAIYRGDSLYWDNLFSNTRQNRAKKRFSRGYIELIFNDYNL